MSESEDDSSKTEDPTFKKLEDARKKGQIASTRELYHFSMMLGFVFFVFILGPKLAHDSLALLTPFIASADRFDMSPGGVNGITQQLVIGLLMLLMLPFLLTFVAALAPAFIQRKIVFASEHIKMKFSKISPLAGFKRIFGMKAIVEFIKNFIKIMIVGIICAMTVMPYRDQLPQLMRAMTTASIGRDSQRLSGEILIAVCILLFFLAIVDYLYQRFNLMKSLRMSKHEVKEEFKQQEGDPHVKQRVRQLRRERARKRMMANVPKADVIITNPTHYAIALKYDAASMQAPLLLAKGIDEVAARIREKAGEHKIPIVRNPPLARILYDTTDIDEEIPIEHYQAVAKIIGYVYRLKGKKVAAGNGQTSAIKKSDLPTLKLKK